MAREWSTWFLGCLLFLVGTIFLFSTVEDFDQVFPRGLDYVLEDFWYWLLGYLPWLLPICCLGASLFTLSFAKKRGEWTAMLSNGIAPTQCFFLITLLGFGIGWTSDWIMNTSGNRSMGLSDSHVRSLKMQIGSDRLWYFRSFDPSAMIGNDLQLFCYGKNGEDVMRVRAQSASWHADKGWTFNNGRFLGFFSSHGLPVIDTNNSSIKWEQILKSEHAENIYHTKSPGINRKFEQLSGLNFKDDPNPYLWLQKRAKEMSTFEIDRLLEEFPNRDSEDIIPYLMRRAQLWWNGPACLVALLIGLGLGSSRGVSTPAKLGGISLLGALGFYLLRTFSDSLGEQQILSPFISASLPYILVILGTILFLKSQK
jgi:lipopolysaccharide export LptBFGC system permease protein LptF